MNKQRRKELEKAHELISEAMEIIEEVKEEEYSAFENLPDSLQQSERGERMYGYYETMDELSSELEDATLELEGVIND